MNYKIIGKYIKDLNFNIPNSKTFFLLNKDISNYKINIDIKSDQLKENIIEILITLNLKPTKNDFEKINTKIVFATIVELSRMVKPGGQIFIDIEKKEIEKIILVDVPSKIYNELRNIFISLFENSGFKDIKINENVDFQKLYNMKKIQ